MLLRTHSDRDKTTAVQHTTDKPIRMVGTMTTVTVETTAIITAMATIQDINLILMQPERFEGISSPSPDEGGPNETSNDSDNGFSGADHHTP